MPIEPMSPLLELIRPTLRTLLFPIHQLFILQVIFALFSKKNVALCLN